jgi:hypothetical protein
MGAAADRSLVDRIYDAAWDVRYYRRPHQAARRAQAVQLLGLAAREALNSTDDFEPILYAICDALAEIPDPRFVVVRR